MKETSYINLVQTKHADNTNTNLVPQKSEVRN